VAGALILVAAASLTVNSLNARPAQAAPLCDMWALTDRVDRQGRMYGAGGVYRCRAAVTKYIDVHLYRDRELVAEAPAPHGAAGPDCRSLPCASNTPDVDINGSHTWCTHVIINFIQAGPAGSGSERQIHCTVT
jgi:hypothetical protein